MWLCRLAHPAANETQKNSRFQVMPRGRLGKPEEYASPAVDLASVEHDLVGPVMSPNGGLVI